MVRSAWLGAPSLGDNETCTFSFSLVAPRPLWAGGQTRMLLLFYNPDTHSLSQSSQSVSTFCEPALSAPPGSSARWQRWTPRRRCTEQPAGAARSILPRTAGRGLAAQRLGQQGPGSMRCMSNVCTSGRGARRGRSANAQRAERHTQARARWGRSYVED